MKCPSCKMEGTLSDGIMTESGVEYGIKKCSNCNWWGQMADQKKNIQQLISKDFNCAKCGSTYPHFFLGEEVEIDQVCENCDIK